MCGIVGYIGTQDCGPILLNGLRRLEYRGYDSAGIAIHNGASIQRLRAEGKLDRLQERFYSTPIKGTTGIGHTRWATHGKPTERNAHPHQVGDIVIVHNGIVENYMELRQKLISQGHTFSSDTDTETIAHLIVQARTEENSLQEAVAEAVKQVRGSYALVVMELSNPDELVATRHASPLVLGIGENEMFAASDVPAIMSHTRNVVFLEDHDIVTLSRDGVIYKNILGETVERKIKRILWDPVSAEKQGYRHFMLKEIHEQPAKIVDTLRGRISLEAGKVVFSEVKLTSEFIKNIDRIVIIACGTSYHAGLIGRYAIEELARIPVSVELGSEFRYRKPIMGSRTLAIAVSQSGETADTLASILEAKRLGAKTLAICNVMESSIPRACDATIYTHAGPEIGVASTKAFTTQLSVFYLFSLWLTQITETISFSRRLELLQELRRVPGLIETALEAESSIYEIARKYAHATSFLFLGRGIEFPAALEGALKLKEISYIHAEGYPAGELKHGPIALVDEHTPVVCLLPRDRNFEKTLSNMQEVHARGGIIIALTSKTDEHVRESANDVLLLPELEDIFMPILISVQLQLLAYAVADIKGTDIDQPRNLAKSVTVE